jgi:hypothetical protein
VCRGGAVKALSGTAVKNMCSLPHDVKHVHTILQTSQYNAE